MRMDSVEPLTAGEPAQDAAGAIVVMPLPPARPHSRQIVLVRKSERLQGRVTNVIWTAALSIAIGFRGSKLSKYLIGHCCN